MNDSIPKVTPQNVQEALNPDNIKGQISDSIDNMHGVMSSITFKVIDKIPSLVISALVLIVGVFVIRLVINIVRIRLEKRKVDVSLRGFLMSIIKFVLYVLLFLVVAQNLGFQMTAILGALSGMVLAIGLALQGSLSNFAGGVLILLFRPFEVGDYIENNANTDGTVEKIDLLYTTLRTMNGIVVYSPNGALANSVIRNFTKTDKRRFEYIIGISYDDNIQTAKNIIMEVLNNEEVVIKDPAPDIFVSELADSSVNLTIRIWAKRENYVKAMTSIQEKIKVALDEGGISIPFPQREMRIVNEQLPPIN